MNTSPASAKTCPSMIPNVVLLPAPLWPSRPKISPRSTVSERSRSAGLPLKDFDRFFNSIMLGIGRRAHARFAQRGRQAILFAGNKTPRPAVVRFASASDLQLSKKSRIFPSLHAKRRGSQVVRPESAKPLFGVSIPPPLSLIRSGFAAIGCLGSAGLQDTVQHP